MSNLTFYQLRRGYSIHPYTISQSILFRFSSFADEKQPPSLSSRPNWTSRRRNRLLSSHCRHLLVFVLSGSDVSSSSVQDRNITVRSYLHWRRTIPTCCHWCILFPTLPSPLQKQDQRSKQQQKNYDCESNPHFRTRGKTFVRILLRRYHSW